MYERFTDRARKIMQLANQEAQRFNHEYIGTEHILLGLVKEGTGVGARALKNLGIDLDIEKFLAEIKKIVQSGPDMVTMGKLPQTPRAKKVIEYSMEEARNLNHNYVGTEHLLLGMLREQEGIAAVVLTNLGVTVERVRDEVLLLLGDQISIVQRGVPYQMGLGIHRAIKSVFGWLHKPQDDEDAHRYERFTDRAQKVIQLANEAACRFNNEYVGTEHLLLGLASDASCIAAIVLKNLGIEPQKIRGEIEKIVPSLPDMVTKGKLPQTPRARQAIQYAREEARNLNHNYVGTEHLLLGLLRAQEGVAGQVLINLGLKLDEVREEVLKLRGGTPR